MRPPAPHAQSAARSRGDIPAQPASARSLPPGGNVPAAPAAPAPGATAPAPAAQAPAARSPHTTATGPAATGPATTQAGVTKSNGNIVLKFKDASVEAILDELSSAAGFVIVKQVPRIEGRVTVTSPPLTPEEAVSLLNTC